MFLMNFDKKILEEKDVRTIPTICAWSDLLGFSNGFVTSEWNPTNAQWVAIAERLQVAQYICARNLNPLFENVLVSNDAFIRNLNFERINNLTILGMWFRSILYMHMQINTDEQNRGLPGVRTIISGGERLLHNFTEITYDDYVYNYTKPNPSEKGTFAKKYGDFPIMYNHSFLQMNTAFSRSYIIDSAGSKNGISGNDFYIDESTMITIKKLATHLKIPHDMVLEQETNEMYKFVIKTPDSPNYYLGFEFENPSIPLRLRNIDTRVYRLNFFYPWDEDPSEFKFNVKEEMPYFSPVILPDSFFDEIKQ